MGDRELTYEQARELLEKLSCDDSFRALFETAPARALATLGVQSDTIVYLPAACLQFRKLAPKSDYQDLLKSCEDVTVNGAMKMVVPNVKMAGQ